MDVNINSSLNTSIQSEEEDSQADQKAGGTIMVSDVDCKSQDDNPYAKGEREC